MNELQGMEAERLIREASRPIGDGAGLENDYLIKTAKTAQMLSDRGLSQKNLFLDLAALSDEEIGKLAGKGYGILRTPEDAGRIDRAMEGRVSPGRLEPVGLILDGKDPSRLEEQVRELARAVRKSRNLTIRSLFLDLGGQEIRPEVLSEAFSRVKKIRSDIPCQLEIFCFLGLGSDELEDPAILSELERIANLNETSLYARFLIGD